MWYLWSSPVTTSKFLNSLNFEILPDDIPVPQSVDEAYQKVNLWYISYCIRQACKKLNIPPQYHQLLHKFSCVNPLQKESEVVTVKPIGYSNSEDENFDTCIHSQIGLGHNRPWYPWGITYSVANSAKIDITHFLAWLSHWICFCVMLNEISSSHGLVFIQGNYPLAYFFYKKGG